MTASFRLHSRRALQMFLLTTLASCAIEGYVPGEMKLSGSSAPGRYIDGTLNTIKHSFNMTIDGTQYSGIAKVGESDAHGSRAVAIEPSAESTLTCHFQLISNSLGTGECVMPDGKRYSISLSGPPQFHVREDSETMPARA